eukprot:CAMPEP_0203019464 /NCGR_PEP_ID=MMETSP1401-20130829/25713_1 /ASSEMBLY_ACC=CAM_ASM_000894 /TAXON_ID=38833 /ORGANISM="Micromonas pusilla, Strain CCAC1681" /LENGTH=187 /DNA_ID=CAMNT_0049761221 /DNA_START=125 /DNA_END=688 /DNA_ORIENTATION=-
MVISWRSRETDPSLTPTRDGLVLNAFFGFRERVRPSRRRARKRSKTDACVFFRFPERTSSHARLLFSSQKRKSFGRQVSDGRDAAVSSRGPPVAASGSTRRPVSRVAGARRAGTRTARLGDPRRARVAGRCGGNLTSHTLDRVSEGYPRPEHDTATRAENARPPEREEKKKFRTASFGRSATKTPAE